MEEESLGIAIELSAGSTQKLGHRGRDSTTKAIGNLRQSRFSMPQTVTREQGRLEQSACKRTPPDAAAKSFRSLRHSGEHCDPCLRSGESHVAVPPASRAH